MGCIFEIGDYMGFTRSIIVSLVCLTMAILPITAMADGPDSSNGDSWYSGEDIWWPEQGHFNYSDGRAVGSYLNFGVNESTGIITDYMVTISTYGMIYPIMVYEEYWYIEEDGEITIKENFPEYNLTYENVTIFDSIEIEGFNPLTPPGTFSDLFILQAENALMIFYDRDWQQSYIASGDANITIIFEVAEGLEIVEFPYYWEDDWYYEEEWEEGERGGEEEEKEGEKDDWDEGPEDMEEYYYETPWNEIWIESENTTTYFTLYNGDYTVDNNTISILLEKSSYLELNTWVSMPIFPVIPDIWYDDPEFEDEMETIELAKQEGYIAGEGWYYEDNEEYQYYEGDTRMDNSDFYSYEDPTFNMEFLYISDEGIEIEVESRIPEGRVVMVNLDEEALEAKSIEDLIVKLDDEKIGETGTLEELMDQVGGTDAKYFAMFSEKGTTVFVYVPHFSTHTITIESVLGSGGILGAAANVVLPAVLALVVVAVAALAVFIKGKKNQDEL